MTSILAERFFTPSDQARFAALSGDFNPIHVDEVVARRTVIGAPVVHGVHLLCWSLETWIGSKKRGKCALESLTVAFHRGALLGETLILSVLRDEDEFLLRIQRSDQSAMMAARVRLGQSFACIEALLPMIPMDCRVLDPADLAHAAGSLPLAYCAAEAASIFPQLTVSLPPLQLAALLATTRLVGMECPGLHSLYAGLELTFSAAANGEPALNYRVTRADRSGAVSLAVDGPGFQGKVRAILRPAPRKQPPAQELAQLVTEKEFADQRALVIGGSRGLGEVTAKLLAMGGAEVTITYHLGKADAEAIAAEISAAGGKCAVAHFDSSHPALIELPEPADHVYYFATPHIASEKTSQFSEQRFAEYCRYYVTGFAQTLLAVGKGTGPMEAFYPSTVFLDERPPNMAEYCAAKAAGEEVCKQIAKQFPRWHLYAPRLPRMHTDQNNGILPPNMKATEVVMLQHLRKMREECA